MKILIIVSTQYILYTQLDATLSANKTLYGHAAASPHGV